MAYPVSIPPETTMIHYLTGRAYQKAQLHLQAMDLRRQIAQVRDAEEGCTYSDVRAEHASARARLESRLEDILTEWGQLAQEEEDERLAAIAAEEARVATARERSRSMLARVAARLRRSGL